MPSFGLLIRAQLYICGRKPKLAPAREAALDDAFNGERDASTGRWRCRDHRRCEQIADHGR